MTPELTALALCGLLQAVQFALFAVPANMELSPKYTGGSRDKPPTQPLSIRTARLQRAFSNHFEALIFFTLAVVVVTMGNQSTPTTQTAAWLFFAARVLYIPAYAFGLNPWRSIIFSVGFFATLTMLIAALI